MFASVHRMSCPDTAGRIWLLNPDPPPAEHLNTAVNEHHPSHPSGRTKAESMGPELYFTRSNIMEALVKTKPGKGFMEIKAVADPEPEQNEVLIRAKTHV